MNVFRGKNEKQDCDFVSSDINEIENEAEKFFEKPISEIRDDQKKVENGKIIAYYIDSGSIDYFYAFLDQSEEEEAIIPR